MTRLSVLIGLQPSSCPRTVKRENNDRPQHDKERLGQKRSPYFLIPMRLRRPYQCDDGILAFIMHPCFLVPEGKNLSDGIRRSSAMTSLTLLANAKGSSYSNAGNLMRLLFSSLFFRRLKMAGHNEICHRLQLLGTYILKVPRNPCTAPDIPKITPYAKTRVSKKKRLVSYCEESTLFITDDTTGKIPRLE